MKVLSITVFRPRYGSDIVNLTVDLPSASHPYDDLLDLRFTASRGTGMEYAAKHFPDVAAELIDMSRPVKSS